MKSTMIPIFRSCGAFQGIKNKVWCAKKSVNKKISIFFKYRTNFTVSKNKV